MSSDNHYRQFGEQLDDDIEDIRARLHEIEQAEHDVEVDLEELANAVAAILDERETEPPDHEHRPGLTEERVIELIGEHAPAGGGGEVGEDLRHRLEAMLRRLDASLKELEKDLSRVVGPSPDQLSSAYHSNPGWGIHFETEYPIRMLQGTIKANQSGYVNFEAVRYDPVEREPQGVEDSALIGVFGAGEHTVDLDLDISEAGNYVLTRDFVDSPADEDRVAMRRTDDDYGGWTADSGDGVTFHGGVDAGGRWSGNQFWYYLADLHIRDAIPDTGEGDEDGGGESPDEDDGFGEGDYGEGPYGDGNYNEQDERPTFG